MQQKSIFISLEGGQILILQSKILTFQKMSFGNGTVNLKLTKLSYGKKILKTNSLQEENQNSLSESKEYMTAMMQRTDSLHNAHSQAERLWSHEQENGSRNSFLALLTCPSHESKY